MTKKDLMLNARPRAIKDRLEIYNLIAGHPPSAANPKFARVSGTL
jgi:hypothetical protein